jgi:hypothetical protein
MARVSQPGAKAGGPSRDAVRRAAAPRPREDDESLVDADSLAEQGSTLDGDSLVQAATEAAALDAAVVSDGALGVVQSLAEELSRPDPEHSVADPAEVAAARRTLTDRERAMLEFERLWWRHAGAKEQAIRETFELSSTHYYRLLNALLDVPAAVEFDALVVGRLRRLRASRARRRGGR